MAPKGEDFFLTLTSTVFFMVVGTFQNNLFGLIKNTVLSSYIRKRESGECHSTSSVRMYKHCLFLSILDHPSIASFNLHFFICSFISSSICFLGHIESDFAKTCRKISISRSHSSISVITLITSKRFNRYHCNQEPFGTV